VYVHTEGCAVASSPQASFYERATYDTELCQALLIAAMSLMCDIGVLYYHWTRPAHPKFLMRKPRMAAIRVHVISGTIEIVCGTAAWFAHDPSFLVNGQIVAALFHILTAIYQTPIVFGMQAIMVPAYIYCVGAKLYCAIDLVFNRSCYFKVLRLFVVHSIYAWCRFFFVLFQACCIFDTHLYTVSIMFAGLVCLPVVGSSANLACVILIAIWNGRLLMFGTPHQRARAFHENARDMFDNAHFEDEIGGGAAGGCIFAQREPQFELNVSRLKDEFDALDADGSGQIDLCEIEAFCGSQPHKNETAKALVGGLSLFRSAHPHLKKLNFDEFCRIFRKPATVSNIPLHSRKGEVPHEVVFQAIDQDNSGFIKDDEMALVMMAYGLPASDVTIIMAERNSDGNADGRGIDMFEFEKLFKPFWSFQYNSLKQKRAELKIERLRQKYREETANSLSVKAKSATNAKAGTVAPAPTDDNGAPRLDAPTYDTDTPRMATLRKRILQATADIEGFQQELGELNAGATNGAAGAAGKQGSVGGEMGGENVSPSRSSLGSGSRGGLSSSGVKLPPLT
jgi:Ca2+-binding EF-hand superfamily protein